MLAARIEYSYIFKMGGTTEIFADLRPCDDASVFDFLEDIVC